MRKVLLVMILSSAALIYAGKYEPVYTGSVPYSDSMNHEEVEKAIKKALIAAHGWSIREVKRKEITARLVVRAHQADVKITYGGGMIKIEYDASMNLGYSEKGGEPYIHRNYNRWIRNLERYISQNVLI